MSSMEFKYTYTYIYEMQSAKVSKKHTRCKVGDDVYIEIRDALISENALSVHLLRSLRSAN